jgi:GH15 family glucan-1,4-alpha-glucosidase
MQGPVAAWRELRRKIHDDVCRNGFNAARGCFVQSYGSQELDASLLLIPITGFLPPADPRVVSTVRQIEEELVVDGFVRRYRTRESIDGLPPGEGVFLACSFWLVDNLLLQGRAEEARALSSGCSRCATTSACCRRSTTRSRGASSATSRRRSRTSPSSTPR